MNRTDRLVLVALCSLVLSGCDLPPFVLSFQPSSNPTSLTPTPQPLYGPGPAVFNPPSSTSPQAPTSQAQSSTGGYDSALLSNYDISALNQTYSATSSFTIQPKDQVPSRVDAYMLTDTQEVVSTLPSTAYLKVAVFSAPTVAAYNQGPDGCFYWSKVSYPNMMDPPSDLDKVAYTAQLYVQSFDGTYQQIYRVQTLTKYQLDGAPLDKPLYLRAVINGFTGYSKPFVLANSLHTISGQYIPVEEDILVKYAF